MKSILLTIFLSFSLGECMTHQVRAQQAAPPGQAPAEPYVLVTEKLWLEAIELIKLQQQLIQHLRKRAKEKMQCS